MQANKQLVNSKNWSLPKTFTKLIKSFEKNIIFWKKQNAIKNDTKNVPDINFHGANVDP